MAHDHAHDVLPFWKRYIFSTDHKVIGIQYGITGLVNLFLGFCMMVIMRWSMAYPDQPVPVIGKLFADSIMPGGIVLPEFYNSLGAMHGTIMVFMGVVPLVFGAFGNFVVPLQIGAPDMAFPKINMASYWFLYVGSILMYASFFLPGGAASSGWTSYPPLANIATTGQTRPTPSPTSAWTFASSLPSPEASGIDPRGTSARASWWSRSSRSTATRAKAGARTSPRPRPLNWPSAFTNASSPA